MNMILKAAYEKLTVQKGGNEFARELIAQKAKQPPPQPTTTKKDKKKGKKI